MTRMTITISGAGAIGGITGARLAQAGHDVLLVDKAEDHVAAMNARGLTLESHEAGVRGTAGARAQDIRIGGRPARGAGTGLAKHPCRAWPRRLRTSLDRARPCARKRRTQTSSLASNDRGSHGLPMP